MRLLLSAAIVAACPSAAVAQVAPKIPVSDFAAQPVVRTPELSPDGSTIVAKSVSAGNTSLVFMKTGSPGAVPKIIGLGKYGVSDMHWAGNGKLLIELRDKTTFYGMEVPVGRLVIYDVVSGKMVVGDRASSGLYAGDVLFVDPTGQWAIIAAQRNVYETPAVKRLDIATGQATVIEKPRPDVWDWYVDTKGVVRGGIAYDDRRWKIWYRSKEGEPFRTLSGKYAKKDDSAIDRIIFSRDGDLATIVTNEKTGRFGLYRYDFAKDQIGETLFENPVADIDEVYIDRDSGQVSGVRYHDDRWHTAWLDADLKALQGRLDRALPGADNIIVGDADAPYLLISSSSASDPGAYHLFDRAKRTLTPVVIPYANVDPAHLAAVKPVQYKARDGLAIPAYLTLPRGKTVKGLPLIIMPHGGPFARDEWTYDPFVQFLANRGYAVLQPQFRGTTGYGKDYVARGYGEYGRKMQDDLDDGLDWLVAQGIVDPKRVCLFGASYGGYAALWGAIRNPERYRCAASYAGVTDLDSQLKYDRKSFSATRYFKSWRTKVQGSGDFNLASVSPLPQASRLTVPVLIAHGEADTTVPPRQSHAMVEALEKRKADVTSVFYKEEEHGFSNSEDMADFLKRLEAFLAKNNPA